MKKYIVLLLLLLFPATSWAARAAASGSVTQANMRLSIVNGTAFADFSSAGTLTPYLNYRLVVTDSAGKKLIGYVKAAGTGETYGSELLSNTTFNTNTTGWNAFNSTISRETSSCYSGAGCLKIAGDGSHTGNVAWQNSVPSVTAGMLVKGLGYVKSGTRTAWYSAGFYEWNDDYTKYSQASGVIPASWTLFSNYVVQPTGETTLQFSLESYENPASTTYMYYDEVSMKQVLTPSTTGVTITSTSGGTTYNWESEESGFNRNDSSNYTYALYEVPTNYYVDCGAAAGGDGSSGTPWDAVADVNGTTFYPGDNIYFKRGCTFREQLSVPSSGSSGSPITISAYGTGAIPIIDGSDIFNSGWVQSKQSLASGTVTNANIVLSAINGNAFVDFKSAGALTNYIGGFLTITDSGGKKLTGYIKAAGSGETFGNELLSNTSFDSDTSGWSAFLSTIASVAGGQSGNCLQVTNNSVDQAFSAWQSSTPSVTAGKAIKATGYIKNGTASYGSLVLFEFNDDFTVYSDASGGFADWTLNSHYATQPIGETTMQYSVKGWVPVASGQTMLFDTLSMKEVLTPSATGVTIVSTFGGTTYNWTSEESGFNRNDASDYTYTIENVNVWRHAYNPAYISHPWVFLDGVATGSYGGNPTADLASVNSAGEWFWDGSEYLYLYSTSDPATAWTNPGVEVAMRSGTSASNKSYVTWDSINIIKTCESAFDLYNCDNCIVKNSASTYAGKRAILFNAGSDNGEAYNNTLSYSAEATIAVTDSNDCLIHDNDISHSSIQADDHTGIGVVGNSGGNRVYNNYVHDSTEQQGPVGINGITLDFITEPKVNYVYNNRITNYNGSGIIIQTSKNQQIYYNVIWGNPNGTNIYTAGIKDATGEGNIYYNNTCYNNGFAEMEITSNSTTGPIVKNNIFYSGSGTSWPVFTNGTEGDSATWDYNIVYSSTKNPYNWDGTEYANAADLYAAKSDGQHDINSDPLFISTTNFHIKGSSPARRAGADLNLTTDYAGRPVHPDNPCIGAYEYGGGKKPMRFGGKWR